MLVLIFRIGQYAGSIKLYNSMLAFLNETIFTILTKDYTNEVRQIRHIGQMQIGSDYSKYALAFYQLASMCELAIVIRFSVYHMIKKEEYEDMDVETDESLIEH